MSEFGMAFAAWREVGHLAEYTGLSIGALVGLGFLFFYVPGVRLFVAAAAIAVVAGGLGLVHGEAVGHRDGMAEVETQWADARKAAIAADAERDAMTERALEDKYGPQLADLQGQAAANQARADEYERKIVGLLAHGAGAKGAASAAGPCELGDAADRLPAKHKAPQLHSR